MHIYDVLNNREISFIREAKKLQRLLSEREGFYRTSSGEYSFFEVIEHHFRDLPLSGNFISSAEFMTANDFSSCYAIEDFCLLCEKIISLIYQILHVVRLSASVNIDLIEHKIRQVMKVIDYDLQKTGFKVNYNKDEQYGDLASIYPRNTLMMKAIETEPDLAEAIINYSRPSLEGNLIEKEKYLHFIIKEVEHIAQDKRFRYPRISEQAETIFNMFHIRHDNIRGKIKNELLPKMTDKELENILDMGYQLSLELLVLNEFKDINDKVDALRERLKQK